MHVRVCFVCLGNICRSPTAEGVFRSLVEEAGLADRIAIDSAGTGGWHEGDPPDRRARAAAHARGIVVGGRARPFHPDDFDRFDYVVAMDAENLAELSARAPNDEARARLSLLRDFDPEAPSGAEVPDPYYGGPDGFDRVLDLCLASCRALLDHVRERDLGSAD